MGLISLLQRLRKAQSTKNALVVQPEVSLSVPGGVIPLSTISLAKRFIGKRSWTALVFSIALLTGLWGYTPPVGAEENGLTKTLGRAAGWFNDLAKATAVQAKPAQAAGPGPVHDAFMAVTPHRFSRFFEPSIAAVKRATGVNIRKDRYANDTQEEIDLVIKSQGGNATIIWGDLDLLYSQMKFTPGQWKGFDLRGVEFINNPLLVITRPDSPIVNLTKEQFTDILSGRKTRFAPKGPNGPQWEVEVQVMSSTVVSEILRRDFLNGRPFGEHVSVAEGGTLEYGVQNLSRAVTNGHVPPTPKHKVGVTTIGIIDCWNFYPYRRMIENMRLVDTGFEMNAPYTLITKGPPSPAISTVMSYFKGEGKDFVTAVAPLK